MNIQRQLHLFLAIAAALLLALSVTAWRQFQRNDDLLRQLVDRSIPGFLAASELVSGLQSLHLGVARLASEQAGQLTSARQEVEAARTVLIRQLAELDPLSESQAQKGLVLQARESLDNYGGIVDQIIKLRESGQRQLAEAQLEGAAVPYMHEFAQILETLRVEKRRSQSEAIAAAVSGLRQSLWVLAFSSAGALGVMGYLGLRISRRIRRRVQLAVQFAEHIAAGRLDYQMAGDARDQDDEISSLLHALESMRESLARQFAQLEQQTRRLMGAPLRDAESRPTA